MRFVRAAAGGEHDGRSGDGELGPVVLADAVDVEADLVGELDLLHEVAQALLRADPPPWRVSAKRVDADLHDLVLPVVCDCGGVVRRR